MQVHQVFSLLGGRLEAFHLLYKVQENGAVATVSLLVIL
jgi:hypothetical protein